MQGGGKLKIYTDGQCPFCLWSRRLVEPYDAHGSLEFRDFNDPAAAAETPFSLDQLHREMHVLAPGGQWHVGYAGWVAILEALPRWRWLARVLGVRPLRWLGSRVYRWIAQRRYRLPGFLHRVLGVPRRCEETCAVSFPGRH